MGQVCVRERCLAVRLVIVGCAEEDGVGWADGLRDMTHPFENEESLPGNPGR